MTYFVTFFIRLLVALLNCRLVTSLNYLWLVWFVVTDHRHSFIFKLVMELYQKDRKDLRHKS